MKLDPFTGEEYEGRMVTYNCDSCNKPTEYEEDAYGQDFLVICDDCAAESRLLRS